MPTEINPAIQRERLHFRTLLLSNPNYFGNVANSPFKPVVPIQANKNYEEIGCVGACGRCSARSPRRRSSRSAALSASRRR